VAIKKDNSKSIPGTNPQSKPEKASRQSSVHPFVAAAAMMKQSSIGRGLRQFGPGGVKRGFSTYGRGNLSSMFASRGAFRGASRGRLRGRNPPLLQRPGFPAGRMQPFGRGRHPNIGGQQMRPWHMQPQMQVQRSPQMLVQYPMGRVPMGGKLPMGGSIPMTGSIPVGGNIALGRGMPIGGGKMPMGRGNMPLGGSMAVGGKLSIGGKMTVGGQVAMDRPTPMLTGQKRGPLTTATNGRAIKVMRTQVPPPFVRSAPQQSIGQKPRDTSISRPASNIQRPHGTAFGIPPGPGQAQRQVQVVQQRPVQGMLHRPVQGVPQVRQLQGMPQVRPVLGVTPTRPIQDFGRGLTQRMVPAQQSFQLQNLAKPVVSQGFGRTNQGPKAVGMQNVRQTTHVPPNQAAFQSQHRQGHVGMEGSVISLERKFFRVRQACGYGMLRARQLPSVASLRVGKVVEKGTAFEIMEMRQGTDGNTYLKLLKNEGWVFMYDFDETKNNAPIYDKPLVEELKVLDDLGTPPFAAILRLAYSDKQSGGRTLDVDKNAIVQINTVNEQEWCLAVNSEGKQGKHRK